MATTPEEGKIYSTLAILGCAGLIAGLGALLASKETLTVRIVIGRAISSFALGVGAAAILALIPGLSFYAQVGIACILGSLGTSGVERLIQKIRG